MTRQWIKLSARDAACALLLAVAFAGCSAPSEETTPTVSAETSTGSADLQTNAPAVQPGMPRVRLRWRTNSETDAEGFRIHRCTSPDLATCIIINMDDPVMPKGTTDIPQEYVYYDVGVEPDRDYWYRVAVYDSRRVQGQIVATFIVGEVEAVKGYSKPLTEEEVAEIRERGIHYRTELSPES